MKEYYTLQIGDGFILVLSPEAIFYIAAVFSFILISIAGYFIGGGVK